MAQKKLTMSKGDVRTAISCYVLQNFPTLFKQSKEKPDKVTSVLATIQDLEYFGSGKYNVVLDIYGTETNEIGERNENIHYTSSCMVVVGMNADGEPLPKIENDLFLTKR